jgi:hypothetical protein
MTAVRRCVAAKPRPTGGSIPHPTRFQAKERRA